MPRSSTLAAMALLVAAATIALVPVGHHASTALATEAARANQPLRVVATPVRRVEGYEVRGQYVGRVVGRRTSALGFDTPGLLDAVLVQEGDRVRQGDVLARLNITRLDARRRQLVAELALGRATYKETGGKLALAKGTAAVDCVAAAGAHSLATQAAPRRTTTRLATHRCAALCCRWGGGRAHIGAA